MRLLPALALAVLLLAAGPTEAAGITPYPGAPACGHPHNGFWHSLWHRGGCHHDHEHGEYPFTPQVVATFPGFNLRQLIGGVAVGHPYPTSAEENTTKHGGFKWQVDVPVTQGCVPFEAGVYGVDAAVVQFHAFGDLSRELEGRAHSTVALLRQCLPGSSDFGYVFTIQHQDYGQRVVPYQGTVLPYPDTPVPAYGGGFGPYWSLDCFGDGLPGCRPSLDYVRGRNLNANSVVTSKGRGVVGAQNVFNLLWRVRDNYQLLDSADAAHPFTFAYICGGAAYESAGCRWNNSTATIHEVGGVIPAAWDGSEMDSDGRPGRVTLDAVIDGFPVKLVAAYVGRYGAELSAEKVSNPTPANSPERDIFFCGDVVCDETAAGAVPSGWIGPGN